MIDVDVLVAVIGALQVITVAMIANNHRQTRRMCGTANCTKAIRALGSLPGSARSDNLG